MRHQEKFIRKREELKETAEHILEIPRTQQQEKRLENLLRAITTKNPTLNQDENSKPGKPKLEREITDLCTYLVIHTTPSRTGDAAVIEFFSHQEKAIKTVTWMLAQDLIKLFRYHRTQQSTRRREYATRFSEEEKRKLEKDSTLPRIANEYHERFTAEEINFFDFMGVTPSYVNKYDARFTFEEIRHFYYSDIHPRQANSYAEKFCGHDIGFLVKAGCTARIANAYEQELEGVAIAVLHTEGITSKQIRQIKKRSANNEHFSLVLRRVSRFLQELYNPAVRTDEFTPNGTLGYEFPMKFVHPQKVLFVGENSLLIEMGDVAMKFSDPKRMQHEAVLLEKVKDAQHLIHPRTLHYDESELYDSVGEFSETIDAEKILYCNFLMDLLTTGNNPFALSVERVPGKTLEEKLRREKRFSTEETLRYATHVLTGLCEMRSTGIIHHRDIRPANIMIHEEQDRAVIIDLGIVIIDRHALPRDNRRYGGPNDLVSLGQIMYKMATGNHLFARDPSMERTTHADELAYQRDLVYADPKKRRLKPYLAKVDTNVHDERVRELITACLTAKNHHYGRMRRMFERDNKKNMQENAK